MCILTPFWRHHAAVPAPVQAGQVVLADVCGTGVAVVATKNIG